VINAKKAKAKTSDSQIACLTGKPDQLHFTIIGSDSWSARAMVLQCTNEQLDLQQQLANTPPQSTTPGTLLPASEHTTPDQPHQALYCQLANTPPPINHTRHSIAINISYAFITQSDSAQFTWQCHSNHCISNNNFNTIWFLSTERIMLQRSEHLALNEGVAEERQHHSLTLARL